MFPRSHVLAGAKVCTWIAISACPAAYAYIDPGSSGMILQIILGAVVAFIVGARLFIARAWQRLKEILGLAKRSGPVEKAGRPPESGH
jgi:hypothetical protein